MKPKFVKLGNIDVLCVRKVGPYSKSGEESFKELMQFAFSKGLINDKTQMFGIAYDDPEKTSEDELRYDACITYDKDIELEEGIRKDTINGGKYIMELHIGPYSEVGRVYDALFGWLERNDVDYVDGHPCVEKYLNNPMDTKPEDLETEVYISVK